MVTDWRKFLPRVIALGATRVVLHVDDFSDDDIAEAIATIKPHLIYLGLSVSNDKNVPAFASLVKRVDSVYSKVFIQVMGIKNIGAQHQPYLFHRIRQDRQVQPQPHTAAGDSEIGPTRERQKLIAERATGDLFNLVFVRRVVQEFESGVQRDRIAGGRERRWRQAGRGGEQECSDHSRVPMASILNRARPLAHT